MIDLIQSPFDRAFRKFAEGITTNCFICSPYITAEPIKVLVEIIAGKERKNNIRIDVLTDISYRSLVQGSTETSALLYLFKNYRNVRITYLPRIHAKVYIADRSNAIVSSANLTHGGGKINFEYGVRINDRAVVKKIKTDMDEYEKLGAVVTQGELEVIHEQVENIKNMIRAEQKSIARTIKFHSTDKQREIEDNLIRARVKNKSVNAIFSETLLYLLSASPAKTRDLHRLVSSIHPDLCDDSTERVIDGKRFGKLWKHQVRNAQKCLRTTGLIFLDGDTKLWHKIRK